MHARPPVLVDTSVIIEAVRTGVWAAITGQLRIESVHACRDEALAGSEAMGGYVVVTGEDLDRMSVTHRVAPEVQARFKLSYDDADALDRGEHDLLAHGAGRGEGEWEICSPDKAAIRTAVRLDFGDRLVSLEGLVTAVGARPKPALSRQYSEPWLRSERTKALLDTA